MEKIPCPDAYLLDPQSPLAQGHHALNQYLLRVEEAGWQKALKEINAVRDKRIKLLTFKALLERLCWLRENNPGSACLSPLRGLAERIEKWTLSPTEADLIELLDRTAELAGFSTPYTPMPHLMAYIEKNGLSERLAAAIRDFRTRVWEQSYTVNQTGLQMFRSRMDMLAWRDEWTEVDLKRCWSERIRADFRSMQGVERENWRRLLYSIHGDEGVRPAPRWMSEVPVIVQAIGPEAFRDHMLRWWEPLQAGATQRLSREGSFLLRALIWAAVAVNDAQLLEKVREIRKVEFKPKNNGEKVVHAAGEATGEAQTTPPPAHAPSLDALTERTLAVVLSPGSSMFAGALSQRIRVQNGVVHVVGDLDAYDVHISTGAIFRVSDGKRVHISDEVSRVSAQPVPDFGGMTALVSQILVLAEDAEHAGAFSFSTE